MSKRPLIAAGLLPLLALAACTGTPNRSLESAHQPVVSRIDYAFDVNTSGNGLAPGEARRLDGWMASLGIGYGDRVAIDAPGRYDVRADVAQVLSRYGLLLSDETPVTGAAVAPGTVRVVVSRMRARVPGCPDYSREGQGPNFESNTSSNFGCATNANLAAMIANPADLVRGQAGNATTDAFSAGKAVDSFRRAAPSGAGGTAIKTESTGGK